MPYINSYYIIQFTIHKYIKQWTICFHNNSNHAQDDISDLMMSQLTDC